MIPCPACGTVLWEHTSNAAPGRAPTEWQMECRTCKRAGALSCRRPEPGMEDFARQYARAAFERWEAREKPPARDWRLLARRIVAGAVGLTGCLIVGAWETGLSWNESPSMPEGLWRVAALYGQPRRGEVVTFCVPDAVARFAVARGYLGPGQCPGSAEELLKPVAAIPGDQVHVDATGVTVNGHTIPHTAALAHDSAGRPLHAWPVGTYRVRPGQVWVVSDHDPRSFDSRYYGPVPLSDIRDRATPIMTGK